MYLLSLERLTFQTTNRMISRIIFIIMLHVLSPWFQLERKKQFLCFLTLKDSITLDSCFKRALCVPAGEGLNQWQRWLSIFFPLEYTTSRLIACINNKPRRGYFGGRFVDHKLINRELFCFSFHISRRYVQDYQDIRAIRIEGIFKDLSQPQTSTCSK